MGKWTGGTAAFGYDARNKKLVVTKTEAETVRTIFRPYLELKSFGRLVAELDRRGVVTKRSDTKVAKYNGGIPFTYRPLAYLLKNRVYIGGVYHGANGSRASSGPSSTGRPLKRFRSYSRPTPTAARSNTYRVAHCFRASSMTTGATSWARAFPARAACVIASMSVRHC
jgi:hypothetical protein